MNPHGLRIHQARMKCREQESVLQRTGFVLGEKQEEPSQESPHRAQYFQAVVPPNPCRTVQQKRIKWPPANSQVVWSQFDTSVNQILETTTKGEVDGRLDTMAAIIVSYAAESPTTQRTVEPLGFINCVKNFEASENSTKWQTKRKSKHWQSSVTS